MRVIGGYLRFAEGDDQLPEGYFEKNIPLSSAESGLIEHETGVFCVRICRFDGDDTKVSTSKKVRTATGWVEILLEEAKAIPARTGEVEADCPFFDRNKCKPCPDRVREGINSVGSNRLGISVALDNEMSGWV